MANLSPTGFLQPSQPRPVALVAEGSDKAYTKVSTDFLLQIIKNYLKGLEFATLTSTCKHFIDIARSKHMWKILCKQQNPVSYPRFEDLIQKKTRDIAKQGLAWQRLYGFQYQGIELPRKQLFDMGIPRWIAMDACDNIAILPNGNIVTSGATSGHAGGIWSSTGRCINKLMPDASSFNKIVVLPNGNFVTCNKILPKPDFIARIWNPSGKLLANLKGHTEVPTDIVLLPNRTIVTVAGDGLICMWSLTGQHLKTINAHTSGINCVATLPGGGFVTGASDGTAIIWSDDGQKRGALIDNTDPIGPVRSITALPNGCIITKPFPLNGTGGLWSPDGRRLKHFDRNAIEKIEILPNGGFVTVGYWQGFVWSADGELLFTLEGHKDIVWSAGVLPNGHIVTGSSDKTVRIWSSIGEHLATLKGNQDEVWCVKILPNGDVLTGGRDAKVRLWSINTDVLVQVTPPWKLFKRKRNAKEKDHTKANSSSVCAIS